MPNWKKIALSGSNPEFASLTVDNSVSAGSLNVDTSVSASSITSTSGSVDNLTANDKLQLGGAGSQFFAYNEDTVKVKFANWYSSNDRQYGMGQLWFETWFAAIDNNANPALRDERRIGFYLEEPDAGASDADGGGGAHPSNARFYVDIDGAYLSGSLQATGGITGSAFTGSFTGDGSGLTGLSVSQTATVSDTFTSVTSSTVTHNFGTKNVIVQVFDNSDNIIIPQSITTSTTSSVDIVLDSATTGRVVVAKGGHIVSGSVDFGSLANTPTLLSSSAQIASDISGSFTAASSSISTRLTTAESELSNTLISSSAQIATDISGSSTSLSSSIAGRVAANESFSSSLSTTPITYTGSFVGDGTSLTGVTSYTDSDTLSYINSVGVLSGSAQIATDISGSFTATSASIASDIANISTDFADITNKPALLSGSAQIASDISGSFTAASASISTRLTTEETNVDNLQSFSSSLSSTIISYTGSFSGDGSSLTGITAAGTLSSSAQIASDISGSLSATAIAALGSGILSGSQTLYSQSFSSATAVTASHGFGTKEVAVYVYDDNDNLFFPTNIKTATVEAVHIDFNTARSGRVVVSKGGHVVDVLPNATTASYVQAQNVDGTVANATTASFASTGPFLSNTGGTVDGDVVITGNITANEYILSSSVTVVTSSFSSGSTIFGDSIDDTHLFTGSLNVTGSANLVASQSVNTRDNSSLSFWAGSQAQYDALGSYDSNKIYFVT